MEKSMEVAGDQEIVPKIDRLSPLPNELLDHIFDLAYSIDTPSTGALSKRLLPFHITGIYRRIHLAKMDNIVQLIQTVNRNTSLGPTIEELVLEPPGPPGSACWAIRDEETTRFFRLLNRLEVLCLNRGVDDFCVSILCTSMTQNALNLPSWARIGRIPFLPILRHFETSMPFEQNGALLDFTSLPSLRTLKIADYEELESRETVTYSTILPELSLLAISGYRADDVSIASFCSLCPTLTHLSLQAELADYEDLLNKLPTALTHLELLNTEDSEGDFCDRALSRFPLLQHLTLGDNLYSMLLPFRIGGFANLESLKLGRGQPSTIGMIRIFSGPNRLPSLRSVELNLTSGEIGRRFQVEIGAEDQADELWDVEYDETEFQDGTRSSFTAKGMRHVVEVARRAGIEVEGSIIAALQCRDAHQLDVANFCIYRCHQEQSLKPYQELSADLAWNSRLPPLDLDSLDPNNLKLVKTDLPEEGWFALTLE